MSNDYKKAAQGARNLASWQLYLADAVERKMRLINEQREQFVTAFLAETGLMPSEVSLPRLNRRPPLFPGCLPSLLKA